jgi:hypothetical protein
MRGSVFLLAALLVTSLIGGVPSPDDCASVEKNGDEMTLRAESWDPVLAIGHNLSGNSKKCLLIINRTKFLTTSWSTWALQVGMSVTAIGRSGYA